MKAKAMHGRITGGGEAKQGDNNVSKRYIRRKKSETREIGDGKNENGKERNQKSC